MTTGQPRGRTVMTAGMDKEETTVTDVPNGVLDAGTARKVTEEATRRVVNGVRTTLPGHTPSATTFAVDEMFAQVNEQVVLAALTGMPHAMLSRQSLFGGPWNRVKLCYEEEEGFFVWGMVFDGHWETWLEWNQRAVKVLEQ